VPADDLQATHRFVRTCEEARIEDARTRYVTVHSDGGLAGAASVTRMTVPLDLLTAGLARGAIRAARRLRPSFLRVPVIFCGLPVSSGQSSLRFRGAADAPAVLGAVCDAMESIARDEGISVECFKEFGDEDRAVRGGLLARGWFAAPSLPSCSLPLPWATFDAYLAEMRSGYRRQVVRSLRDRERDGVRVSVVRDLASVAPRIFPLYEQVMDRAAFRLERLPAAFFERLATNLRAETSAVLVERGADLVAAAVMLQAAGRSTFLVAGLDYATLPETHAYQHLLTGVVAEAIRCGSHTLELGQTAYESKLRMGAAPAPRHVYFRHRRRPAHALLRAASRALFPRVRVAPRRTFRERAAGRAAAQPECAGAPGPRTVRA
jgi:hypothetical protein